jgi:MFS family permease
MTQTEKIGFHQLWRNGEFRALWIAETGSVFGDQVARVALSLLVYARTSSALLTALTYALTFLPAILGGLLLSWLADRFPRRQVIIVTDVVRAALAALLAIPGMPLGVLWVLIGLLTLASGPFKAAQLALLLQILDGDRYAAALALRQISIQSAQLAGFALGGFLVTALSAYGALLANSVTFLASAVLVAIGVRARPAARRDKASKGTPADDDRSAGRLAPIFLLVSLVGLWVVPEGLAAPYVDTLGAAAFAVGILMAADPVGSVLGALLAKGRFRPTTLTLNSLLLPAFAAGVPLIVCAMGPGLVVSALLWAVSGAFSTIFLLRMQPYIASVVPDSHRGTVLGQINACVLTSQGVAFAAGGVFADWLGPFTAVAVSGGAASALVIVTALVWGRARQRKELADEQQPDADGTGQISLLRIATSEGRAGLDGPAGEDSTGTRHLETKAKPV